MISIFLFVIHIKQEKERSFVKVRRYLAYSILIDSITYFMSAVFISMGESCFVLKRFIIPAAFYFQMYLMTFALIEIMFSQEVTKRKKTAHAFAGTHIVSAIFSGIYRIFRQ